MVGIFCRVFGRNHLYYYFNFIYMTNEQQERHRRFEERFPDYSISSHDQDCECSKCNGCIDREEAKAFIDEEVSLAKENGKTEQLLELLQVFNDYFNDYEVPLTTTAKDVRNIISNLIPKNK